MKYIGPRDLVCLDCDRPATWIRSAQFAGKHPFCDQHAHAEHDFGVSDNYKYWYEIEVISDGDQK